MDSESNKKMSAIHVDIKPEFAYVFYENGISMIPTLEFENNFANMVMK
jgi:hypothetical protein